MHLRLLSTLLCLVLLLTQQLGAQHLLSHGLQPAAHGQALVLQTGDIPGQALAADAPASPDAGDALCQICLALATLAAALLPALWGWLRQAIRPAAPLPPAVPPAAPGSVAPYQARGPPAPAVN